MAYDTVIDKTRQQAACKATADAIRGKTGSTAKLTWDPDTGFKNAVNAISTGSTGITPTGTKTITMNGTHNVSEYEYAQVNVETGVTLPTLDPPGTASDLARGKQLIDANGNVVTGSVGTLDNYSGWSNITPIQQDEKVRFEQIPGAPLLIRNGFYLASPLSNFGDAQPEDVTAGKFFTSSAGLKKKGTRASTSDGNVSNSEFIEVVDLSNLHSWNKHLIGKTPVREPVTNIFVGMAKHETGISVAYANGVDTSGDQIKLSQEGANTVVIYSDDDANVLKGKAILSLENDEKIAYEIPTTATFTFHAGSNSSSFDDLRVNNATKVTLVPGTGQLVGVVVSENAEAYPQDGEQNGYIYVYNGTVEEMGKSALTVKTGTTTSRTVDTGLSDIHEFFIYRDGITSTGLIHLRYSKDSGTSYTHASAWASGFGTKTVNTGTSNATIADGSITIPGTSVTNGGLASSTSYTWVAIGAE